MSTQREEWKCQRCNHFIGWNEHVRLIITDLTRRIEVLIIVSSYKGRCPVAGCYTRHEWSPSKPKKNKV